MARGMDGHGIGYRRRHPDLRQLIHRLPHQGLDLVPVGTHHSILKGARTGASSAAQHASARATMLSIFRLAFSLLIRKPRGLSIATVLKACWRITASGPDVTVRPQRPLLRRPIRRRRPRRPRLVVPVGELTRLPVDVHRQRRVYPLALPLRMLLATHPLLVEIPEQLTLALEPRIGRNDANGIAPRTDRGQLLPEPTARLRGVRP